MKTLEADFLTIGQVSKRVGLPASVIRFWETEFSEFIQAVRTQGNQRRYTESSIKTILKIKELSKEKKMRLEGIKDILFQDLFEKNIGQNFNFLIEELSKKVQSGQVLSDSEFIVMIMKHLVRDANYKDGFLPDKSFFVKDFHNFGGVLLKDFSEVCPEKVLLIAFGNLGDTIWIKPFIEYLKNIYPNSEISIFVLDSAQGLFAKHPFIKKEFVLPKITLAESILNSKQNILGVFNEIKTLVKQIRDECFDTVINLKRTPLASIFTYLTHVKNVFGQTINPNGQLQVIGNIWNLLIQNEGFEKSDWLGLHRAEQLLRIVNYKGQDNKIFSTRFSDMGNADILKNVDFSEGDYLIGLQIGARMKTHYWPVDNYVELINLLSGTKEARIFLFGAAKDAQIAEDIMKLTLGKKVYNFVGKTKLEGLISLISKCRLFITPDTGPKHLAVACNVPVIEISNRDNSFFNAGPYGPNCIILRSSIRPKVGQHKDDGCHFIDAKAVFQAVEILKRLLNSDFTNNAIAKEIARDLLAHYSLVGVDVYYSGKENPRLEFSYWPLKENTSEYTLAQRILNHCYVRLWESKNNSILKRQNTGERMSLNKDFLREMFAFANSKSQDVLQKRISKYCRDVEDCRDFADECAKLVEKLIVNENADEITKLTISNRLKNQVLPNLLERHDSAALIGQVNWSLYENNVQRKENFSKQELLEDLLKFPRNVYQDCEKLEDYLKEAAEIINEYQFKKEG